MSKYCPEIVDQICELVKQGNSYKDSCNLCGISEASFYEWKQKYPDFVERLRACDSSFKKVAIEAIKKAGNEKDWRAWGFLLERKYPAEFGQEIKQKLSGYIENSENDAQRKERIEGVRKFLQTIEIPLKSKNTVGPIGPVNNQTKPDSQKSNKT